MALGGQALAIFFLFAALGAFVIFVFLPFLPLALPIALGPGGLVRSRHLLLFSRAENSGRRFRNGLQRRLGAGFAQEDLATFVMVPFAAFESTGTATAKTADVSFGDLGRGL